jgi:predicted transposase YdaD
MSTLGGLIYDPQTLFDIISEETMYESSIAQHFAERGRREGVEQGRKEGRMLSVIDVISARFGSNNAEALKPTLESIEDTALLPRILIKACQVENYSKQ